ncbi:Protein of unknown function [Bacillus cereus]|nr:Protein of unknown function [Bacillus cereus]
MVFGTWFLDFNGM